MRTPIALRKLAEIVGWALLLPFIGFSIVGVMTAGLVAIGFAFAPLHTSLMILQAGFVPSLVPATAFVLLRKRLPGQKQKLNRLPKKRLPKSPSANGLRARPRPTPLPQPKLKPHPKQPRRKRPRPSLQNLPVHRGRPRLPRLPRPRQLLKLARVPKPPRPLNPPKLANPVKNRPTASAVAAGGSVRSASNQMAKLPALAGSFAVLIDLPVRKVL